MGGSSYGRHSPFGFWLEDVRALGFLRPAWAMAHQTLAELIWTDGASPARRNLDAPNASGGDV
jgi:hypothetical protein